MKIKKVKKRPKNGQFIAIWIFNNELYSHTFKYIDKKLHIYDNGGDNKIDSFNPFSFTLHKNVLKTIQYFIYK